MKAAIKSAGKNPAAKNNVIQFPSRRSTKQIIVPANLVDAELEIIELPENVLGFARGDNLICRTDFDASELKPDSLVIAGSKLTVCSAAVFEHISAVVVYLMREV